MIPQFNKVTPFSQVMPYQRIFNPDLMRSLAESQINPEIDRARTNAMQSQDQMFGGTGLYRTGLAGQQRQQLTDSFERQRKEQVQGFQDQIGNYTTDFYNQAYKNYYMNPTLLNNNVRNQQTFDQGMQKRPSLTNMYQKTIGGMTNNPLGI